jgi:uncharacterized protein
MSNDVTYLHASDLILLLLDSSADPSREGRVNGVTRLEKLLFLLDRETPVSNQVTDPFEWRPYNFGPYSKGVYEAVELLEQVGLLTEERRLRGETLDEIEEASATLTDVEGVERCFMLTANGKAVAKLLADRVPEVARLVEHVGQQYGLMPLNQLIRYVYKRYPEYAEKSVIRDDILASNDVTP